MTTSQALAYSPSNFFSRAGFTSSWATSATIVATDFFALSCVYWLAVIGRYLTNGQYSLQFYWQLYPVIGLFLGAFYVHDLYPGVLLHPAEEMRRVFKCITVVFLLIAVGTFLERNKDMYSRSIFLIIWAFGAPTILLARQLARKALAKRPWWGIAAVVLGSGPCAERVVRTLQRRNIGIRVAGILSDEPASTSPESTPPMLGPLSAAPHLAKNGFAEYVVVAMPDKNNSELRYILQNVCRGFSHVLLVPDLPGICSLGISAREIGGEVGLELPQRLSHNWAKVSKRSLDIISSAFFLIILAPLFAIIALAIKLSSRGPVFFGHSRYGKHGETFYALKFRTMVQNADELLASYLRAHPELQAEWDRDHKLRCDPRVSKVGRWLRRYSLDELPQLFNVLIGQMSLVGPRPIVKNEIVKYGDGYELYTRVPPGITGLWQVSGRNNTTYMERVAFDEYYVRNWSVWLDAYILTKTINAVISANGAY
jgi:Undecaprenyl-phosphate galactose phosphotransferase WbaP